MAERPDDLPRRIRELDDGLVLLLVGDDRRAVVDEERVIGEVEAQRIPRQVRRWVPPHHMHRRVHQQQPVVAAVGDEQLGPEVRRARPRRARGSEGAVRAQHLHRRDHRPAGFASHDPGGRPGHRDRGMGYRHLEPGRQQPPGSRVEGPDRRHGGTGRPGLAGQLGRAEAPGRPPGCGAVTARHEHLAVQRDRGSARKRLRKAADDGRRVPGRIHRLDNVHRRPGIRTRDGLPAERVDHAVQGGDGRIAHRNRQRRHRGEDPAVPGGQHRSIGLAPVVAAHDVGGTADRDRRGIRARRRQRSRHAGGAGAGERLDRAHSDRRSAPEDQRPPAGAHPGGIVQRGAERADLPGRPRGRAQRVHAAGRRAGRREPAEHDELAWRSRHHHLTAERCRQVPRQQTGLGGVQDGRRGRSPDRRQRGPVRAGAAVRQDREPRDNGDDGHGHRRHDGTPAAHARRHPEPPGTRLRPSPLTRGFWHRLIMP